MTASYRDTDPYDLPLYSQREAAHVVGASPSTLRSWVAPSPGAGSPVIRLPRRSDGRLSFYNVIEAYVLNLIRQQHGVTMQKVRRAVAYAEKELGIDRLLIRRELRWEDRGSLFWERLSTLIDLSRSGQFAMRHIMHAHLHRIEWDDDSGLPRRFFPLIATGSDARGVVVDPKVGFGQPTVVGTGVGTAIVARRIDAGEDLEAVARDYHVDPDILADALVYEGGA